MKKYQKLCLLLLLTITLTGCNLLKPKPNNEPTKKPEQATITSTDIATMEKASEAIFNTEKESLKVSDLTDKERGEVARNLAVNFQEKSGSEMAKEFNKYFGEGEVVYEDIPCFEKHTSEEEQTLFIFNKEQDKYIFNPKHPGHGGGGKVSTQVKMILDSYAIEGDSYIYNAKILFYGPFWCHDVGGCEYGKAYKSATDVKNEVNALADISANYMVEGDGPPTADMDKVMEDVKDKLDTYQFIFEKQNGNLIFKEYKKA